jgi:tight adherence protein C
MYKLTTYLALLLFLLCAFCFVPSGIAGAQTPPDARARLIVNRLEVEAWPDMAVNLTLVGPDGKAIPGVDASQFQVREQGRPQPVQRLELGASKEVPVAFVLAMDVSGSMNASDKLGQAKNAADTFLGSLRPEDSAALLAFSDRVQEIVPLTGDKGALQAGVNTLQAGGNTAIYDALYASAEVLNKAPAGKRRVIILLTDGTDTSSRYAAPVAADVARNAGAVVYTIGLGPDPNDAILKSLGESGGGKYFKAPSVADLNAIYKAISIELNSQLVVKYHSNARVDHSYQFIKVEVLYEVPGGQASSGIVNYRPPPAAVRPSGTAGESRQVPLPAPAVELPPGLTTIGASSQPSGPLSPTTSSGLSLAGMAAAILAGIAALLGTLGLAVLLMPSLLPTGTTQRIERYLLSTPSRFTHAADKPGLPAPGAASRSILALLGTLGKRLASLTPKSYVSQVDTQLVLTGPPYSMTAIVFLGIQLLLSSLAAGLILFWMAQGKSQTPAQVILAAIAGVFGGAYLPFFWLKLRVARRQKLLLRALPGALDFLAINVEAGLGFDAALAQVVKRWHNTLTDEFALLLIDFQIGKSRKEAWKELIQRTQVPDLTSFITAMLQNEQVGVSISTLLRTQADQMRVRRRQAAEESARTAPVKMLIPMVFCIFPGIFVIILGPAIPQLLGSFMNLGK